MPTDPERQPCRQVPDVVPTAPGAQQALADTARHESNLIVREAGIGLEF